MDTEKYTNQDPYPERPKKPAKSRGAEDTPAQHRKYVDELEAWERDMEKYRTDVVAWRSTQQHLDSQFKVDVLEEYGLTGHPKADLVFMVKREVD
jgi:hypothetical protein